MSPTIDEFALLLVRSGLINDEELAAFRANLPAGVVVEDASALARELVSANRLTKYQAACVFQGKTQGLVLGKYVVLDKIGAGGMGQVFKAFDRRMERVVALKLLLHVAPSRFATWLARLLFRDSTLVDGRAAS